MDDNKFFCECRSAGRKQLAVAWAYYYEIVKGIATWMFSMAENAAWAWWPEKDNK